MYTAVSLLTRISTDRESKKTSVAWFPFIGAVIGGVTGAAWYGAGRYWFPLIAAAIAVSVDVILTSTRPWTGLALVGRPEQSTSRLNTVTSGNVAAALVAIMRISAMAVLVPSPHVLMLLWTSSRGALAMAIGVAARRRRKSESDVEVVKGVPVAVVLTAIVVAPLAWWLDPQRAGIAIAATVFGTWIASYLAQRNKSSLAANALCAAALLGEVCGLLALACRY